MTDQAPGPVETVTLPAAWYGSAELFQREQETIFRREWLLIGHMGELQMQGDYIAAEIAGRPVFVIRGSAGELRAFHNVCRHRAGPIVMDGAGHCEMLRCRYHGWTYDFDGQLRKRPDFGDDDRLAMAKLSLFPVRCETWRGLVFVNLDDRAGPLIEGLGGLAAVLGDIPLESYRFHRRQTYDLDFNWKTYTDNYLEGYHIPYVHPGLSADLDLAKYRVEKGERVCIHRAVAREGAAYQGLFLWRWPNNTIGVYGGGLNICRILPLGPRKLRLVFDFLFADDAKLSDGDKERAAATTCQVVEEDFPICAAVQRNLEAGVYRSGPLSPRHENGVGHFHALVRRAVG